MAYEGWENGRPPATWPRYLSFDVGGATANAMEWVAQDPVSLSLVYEEELYKITTDMRLLADEALPKMKSPSGVEYTFASKVGDYENRVALDDMAKYGIRFDNAVKQNKVLSVHRLASYLHPNPKRPFPAWHPDAGRMGAPLLFISPVCKHLIAEIPQQKWKEDRFAVGDRKDELDRNVKHDAVDCALYIARILPAPATIPIIQVKLVAKTKSLQSALYWEDVRRKEAAKTAEARTKYNPNHEGANTWKSLLGF